VTTIGWVGVWLLVAAGLMLVVEGALAAIWGMAMARRAVILSERLNAERGMVESDLAALRLAMEETQRLWGPYRVILRWLSHPLTIALLGSYRRRLLAR
jgi:hypothetical protein